MKRGARTALVWITLGILIVGAYGRTFVHHSSSDSAQRGTGVTAQSVASDYKRMVAHWQMLFLTRDVRTAYSQYLNEVHRMPSEDGHVVAHVVGGILYDLGGISGLSQCTWDFNYGCYHGFASRVIEEKGTAGIRELTDACKQMSTPDCEHGIGHGLLVLFGDGQLDAALSACSAFSHRSGGCSDGVFMEHFLNTMRRDENRGALAFDDRTPDAPCAAISNTRDREVCYYWLPVLWRSKVRTVEPVAAQFAYVGGLCERVADPSLRMSCFSGAGTQTVLIAEYSEDESRKLCAEMPSEGRLACEREAIDYIHRRTTHTTP